MSGALTVAHSRAEGLPRLDRVEPFPPDASQYRKA